MCSALIIEYRAGWRTRCRRFDPRTWSSWQVDGGLLKVHADILGMDRHQFAVPLANIIEVRQVWVEA